MEQNKFMNCWNTIDLQAISVGFFVAITGLELFFPTVRDGSVVSRNVLSLRMFEDVPVKGVVLVVAVANEKDVVE